MIYISEDSPERLVIESPPTLHRVLGVAFLVVGSLAALSMLSDSDMVNPAMKAIAVVPALLAGVGVLLLTKGNNTDRLEVEKKQNRVRIVINHKTFGRAEPVVVNVDDIEETILGDGFVGGRGDSDLRRSSVRGVAFRMRDGSTLQATLYVSQKKAAEQAFEAVRKGVGR
jgi:hypothetical protein